MSPTCTTIVRALLVILAIALGCGALVIEHRLAPPRRPPPSAGHHQRESNCRPLDFVSKAVIAACRQAVELGRVTYERYYRRAFSRVEATTWDAWYATSGLRSSIAPIPAQDVANNDALTLTDSLLPRADPEHRTGRRDKAHTASRLNRNVLSGGAASRS